MHTHNIIFGAHACRNGKSILYTQGSISIVVTLLNYMLNQMCMRKASVGMYSGCDMLSLRILFVYFLALPSLLHPSILFNCFLYLLYISSTQFNQFFFILFAQKLERANPCNNLFNWSGLMDYSLIPNLW